jgi:uncharacterized protein
VVKGRTPSRGTPHTAKARVAAVPPLSDRDIDELQRLLDAVPAPLEPLDVSSLDGFLCGVLVQPARVPNERWLPFVTDGEGRAPPRGHDAVRLRSLAMRRHAELDAAIARRAWFDPWIFELDDAAIGAGAAVYPWVAGIVAAFELFPGVMSLPAAATLEPLALLYRHLDADDLEDADELLAEIETLEPVADLEEAVEGLVRAVLLLADVTRPLR